MNNSEPSTESGLQRATGGAIKKLADGAGDASGWYSDQSLLRLAVAAIPTIGAVLDGLLALKGSAKLERRFLDIVSLMTERFAVIENRLTTHVSEEYLASDEFFDTVRAVFDAAARTSDREKLNWYVDVLAGEAVGALPKEISAPSLIAALLELSPLEVEIGRKLTQADCAGIDPFTLSEAPGEAERFNVLADVQRALAEQHGELLIFHMKRLERSGFVASATAWGGGMLYYPTPAMRLLLEVIAAPEAAQRDGTA